MRDCLVAAIWTMMMRSGVSFGRPIARAVIRVLRCHLDNVVIDAIAQRAGGVRNRDNPRDRRVDSAIWPQPRL